MSAGKRIQGALREESTLERSNRSPAWQEGSRLPELRLSPILPAWLFTKEPKTRTLVSEEEGEREIAVPGNGFAFRFLGRTIVVYHNPERKDTYGDGAKVTAYRLTYRDGRTSEVAAGTLATRDALDVREGRVARIDAFLGTRGGGE